MGGKNGWKEQRDRCCKGRKGSMHLRLHVRTIRSQSCSPHHMPSASQCSGKASHTYSAACSSKMLGLGARMAG